MKSFGYAINGIAVLFSTQRMAQIHVAVGLAVLVAGAVLGLGKMEWCLVVLASGSVLATEALNTGIEFVCDALHPEHHPLIGKAKDVAAAGVLISAIAAAIVGVAIFGTALWA